MSRKDCVFQTGLVSVVTPVYNGALHLSGMLDSVLRQTYSRMELILSDGSIYSHKGTLETVEGDFERGTGSIAFRVRFPNPDGLLKHGVTGKVRMMTQMDNICLVPQKSTFEIQDFTYVYTVDSASVVKVRSFQPLERYNNYYVTQDFSPNTAIVYEGVQMMKDGITIKTDTIDMEAIRKEVELKQPIVK